MSLPAINFSSILSQKQADSFLRSTKRLNIWEGSVRSGKTIASIYKWIYFVSQLAPHGELIMTGKTQGSLYRNILRPIEDILGNNCHYYHGKQIFTIFDKEIFCFGADDERAEGKIRGMTVAGAYQDEITLSPESYFKQTLGRMSPKGAQYFGSTNPDSPYHFLKTDYIDRKNDLDLEVFHFELDDNPYLDPSYVINLKKEYTGLFYKRFILGQWCMAEGAIFDFFDDKINVLPVSQQPEAVSHIAGIDYGTGNPTCYLLFGVNHNTRPVVWSKKEYYWDSRAEFRQKTDDEYADDFIEFARGVPNLSAVYLDPSAASFRLALEKKAIEKGVFVPLREADNSVVDGIRVHGALLKSGFYAVGEQCPKTIKDYYGYSWDEKAQLRGEDKPDKTSGSDHCLTGDTLVETILGPCQIKDLVGKVGLVYSFLDNKPVFSPFRNARITQKNKQIYLLELANGKNLTATGNHRIFTDTGWKELQHLKEGEHVYEISSYIQRSQIRNGSENRLLSIEQANTQQEENTPSCICLLDGKRANTDRLQCSSCRWKQREQYCKEFDLYFSQGAFELPCQPAFKEPLETDPRDAENSQSHSKSMAFNKRRQKLAFCTRKGSALENGNDNKDMRSMRERIPDKKESVETISILSSELQNESLTTTVKRVTALDRFEDVYCLTVPETGCFAVSGGLIVANSKDAERYPLYTHFGTNVIDYEVFTKN